MLLRLAIPILAACIAIPMTAQRITITTNPSTPGPAAETRTLTAQTMTIQPSTPKRATETRTFALENGGGLKISSHNGAIRVLAWDKDEVALTAKFKSSSRGKHVHIDVQSDKDYLELIVEVPSGRDNRGIIGPSCEMELNVPRHIAADIETINSNILLDSINGKINVETINGEIVLKDVSGDINLSALNGAISGTIQNVKDRLDIDAHNGKINVKLLNLDGTLEASSFRGKIKIPSNPKFIESVDGNVTAKYGDGSAVMNFKNFNGSIIVQRF
ncbi:MAG: DUF4097 family beta strand repeat-containing protein [Holophagales bacterium]|nr:DUF4097 family beta strand repeat-containing protein [Holophagales bacterium]